MQQHYAAEVEKRLGAAPAIDSCGAANLISNPCAAGAIEEQGEIRREGKPQQNCEQLLHGRVLP